MKLRTGERLRASIANYLARFLIWGFCAGGVFGAAIGLILSVHLIFDPIRFVLSFLSIGGFSGFIGAVLAFLMGYGPGIVTGFVAWMFFPDQKPVLIYRTVMVVLAYGTAYLIGATIFRLLFKSSLGQLDGLSAIASIGAGIAAYLITGFLVRDSDKLIKESNGTLYQIGIAEAEQRLEPNAENTYE
jgi:hypothetical protein